MSIARQFQVPSRQDFNLAKLDKDIGTREEQLATKSEKEIQDPET
jgi:hypothetical protein